MLLLGPFSIGLLLLENQPPLQIIFGTRDKNHVLMQLELGIHGALPSGCRIVDAAVVHR